MTDKLASKAGPKGSVKDAQFDAFLEVMQPKGRTGPAWANDEATLFKPSSSKKGKELVQAANEAEADERLAEGLSDLEWMRRRMKENVETAEEKAFLQDEDPEAAGSTKSSVAGDDGPPLELTDSNRNIISQTGRLFVRNLAFSCTENELRDLFSSHGNISQVRAWAGFCTGTSPSDDIMHRDSRLVEDVDLCGN
jgi:multiple RNA-binding domain-containing protein 1